VYLGSSLLLSRLSAEAAKIRYDVNLLWTNKFDRCGGIFGTFMISLWQL
jgi:hypothetical protein